MRCSVCGNEVHTGSPASDICSAECAEAMSRAQVGQRVPEHVKALLREHGKHRADCPRRTSSAAPCTCSLGIHTA